MAYQSSYGSNHPYARSSFGTRYPEYETPAPKGVARSTFAVTLSAAVLFAVWSGATTFYLFFSDDILQRFAFTQSETGRSQDAQIAALTTEIERLRTTKFVDQEKIERQISDLARIQRVIDARQKALNALAQAVTRNPDITGSIPAAAGPQLLPSAADEPQAPPKPRPLSDTLLIDPPLARSASIQSRVNFSRAAATAPSSDGKRQRELTAASGALTKLGAQQAQTLNAIELELDQRAARTRKAIAALGPRLPASATAQAAPVGGPFVAYSGVPEDGFMRQVFRIRLAMEEQERQTRQLDNLPVLLPILGRAEITSGYGPRVDPFLKRLAMHSGVDIRGETGDPVRAAAAGTVVAAERHRAYGLMVDVDHGNGITTRYAHLSAISIKEGAKVPAGAVLGKIGSTGRSTAPHLHFEVRLNGETVDPRRYLLAGMLLAGFQ
jgi:murein DD-endopeptidase MepM/ murein hydrolase activator NlpD